MENSKPAKIKIKRSRRRLYQPLEETAAEPQAAESHGKQPRGATAKAPREKAPKSPSAGRNADREASARRIIGNHVAASMAMGAIPLPWVDLVAVTLLQNRMVRLLSESYDRAYEEVRAKSWIASLTGGAGGVALAKSKMFSAAKSVPLLGAPLGAAGVPIISGATTYAVGMVFREHFRSGGTCLDFHPDARRGSYRRHLAWARTKLKPPSK